MFNDPIYLKPKTVRTKVQNAPIAREDSLLETQRLSPAAHFSTVRQTECQPAETAIQNPSQVVITSKQSVAELAAVPDDII